MVPNKYELREGTREDSKWANKNTKWSGVPDRTLWFNSKRVGVTYWNPKTKSKEFEIIYIAVIPRGKGHGPQFIRMIEDLARRWGYKKIVAWNVDFEAEGFWEEMGYTLYKEEPDGIVHYQKEI